MDQSDPKVFQECLERMVNQVEMVKTENQVLMACAVPKETEAFLDWMVYQVTKDLKEILDHLDQQYVKYFVLAFYNS